MSPSDASGALRKADPWRYPENTGLGRYSRAYMVIDPKVFVKPKIPDTVQKLTATIILTDSSANTILASTTADYP